VSLALSSLMLEHAMITSQSLFFLSMKTVANLFAVFMTVLLAFPADFQHRLFCGRFRAGAAGGNVGSSPSCPRGPVRARWDAWIVRGPPKLFFVLMVWQFSWLGSGPARVIRVRDQGGVIRVSMPRRPRMVCCRSEPGLLLN
jgi:hypothetical protein